MLTMVQHAFPPKAATQVFISEGLSKLDVRLNFQQVKVTFFKNS